MLSNLTHVTLIADCAKAHRKHSANIQDYAPFVVRQKQKILANGISIFQTDYDAHHLSHLSRYDGGSHKSYGHLEGVAVHCDLL